MINTDRRISKERQKEKTRRRYSARIEPDEYYPGSKPADYYDNDIPQRVAIYVRVSTDDVRQTTSFELQKKYYEDFVVKHPHWSLVDIYADEGISGTSLNKREAFNKMIADAKAGKIDLIICKSVSRFARNVVDFIGIVRDLAERNPPVGVFFESEAIFSLNDDSQLALSFQATMAEEESHIRSRSMESSLRMRLDNGIPLTPKLLGYTHDEDGQLIINPEEAPTVKLAYYMYLYGYSTTQIADIFNRLERQSYLGNTNKWTSSSIVQVLRNERHCGDVLTRKTFTPNYRTHKSKKNTGQRPQSRYRDHHEAIIKRDDFIAVQQMLDNAKYHGKSILPELRVIESGILKGFVTVNPRWAGFKEGDYYQASISVYEQDEIEELQKVDMEVEVVQGDLDLRGFEITRSEFFDSIQHPYLKFDEKFLKFNTAIVRRYNEKRYVELLINPVTQKLAIRGSKKENRHAISISRISEGKYYPKTIPVAAFRNTLFKLLGWKSDLKYRVLGQLYEQDGEIVYIFDATEAEAYIPGEDTVRRVKAIPKTWLENFGKEFFVHEGTLVEIEKQSELDWKLRLQGQLFDIGKKLEVTPFEELKKYIEQELGSLGIREGA